MRLLLAIFLPFVAFFISLAKSPELSASYYKLFLLVGCLPLFGLFMH